MKMNKYETCLYDEASKVKLCVQKLISFLEFHIHLHIEYFPYAHWHTKRLIKDEGTYINRRNVMFIQFSSCILNKYTFLLLLLLATHLMESKKKDAVNSI